MDAHLRDLRYFVAVAEELSFTRAAERLYLSQPALSKQIRQLEEGLRVRLLERDHRTVSLTEPGRVLLASARELLARWDETQREVSDAAAAEAAVLTVGLSTSVGRGLLAAARTGFLQRRPHWRTRMRHIGWEDASAGLAGGEVDVAFVWLPFTGQEAFRLKVVAREQRWVAFPEDHWLAGRDRVGFAELLDEPFLALPEGAGPLRDFWLALPERGGRPARIGAVVANPEETFSAVEEGSGIVLLASGNAAIYRRPGIGAVPVTGIAPCELALAWREGDHRVAVRDFVDAVDPAPGP
ncbi:LysR family transcriptional regulator [Actinomadura kijaniata]|uniref:DNA-binding transcriptional LysR family regulator n=1 Tax=Actinomadura namibiensis TaxID=182080 RepID=A0A7W3LS30_ACTNM|nr:LysR family transcriptional regulator [Actinomadura namibiensis]MBA8953240.1 DNA-binding transcriptional LysR family regulator [Actinomadura namibiensis]